MIEVGVGDEGKIGRHTTVQKEEWGTKLGPMVTISWVSEAHSLLQDEG